MRITKYNTKVNRSTARPELVKEKAFNYSACKRLNSPSAIVTVLNKLFDLENQTDEYVYMLTANIKMDINGIFEIGHGAYDFCHVHTRELFSKALLYGAYGIVLVHNHPSGDPYISCEDEALTKTLLEGCNLLGLKLIDHIVVGHGKFLSFQEEGYLE